MGLFLAVSGVVGAKKEAVVAALSSFTATRKGSFRPGARSPEDPNTLVLLDDASRCSVLYPSDFLEWDEVSRDLSMQLGVPVFSFHIHDGDLWMFLLFDKGEQVAQFNPLPEYWDDSISDEERTSWSGDAAAIASCIPGLAADSIRPYLRHWNLDEDNPGKAFPEDQFSYHDCWQLCDFMKRIGLRYPLDERGHILGETFEFVVPEHSSRN
ncbi:MAG TPA: hypothetical protein PLX89_10215 [Verrucomicrobiota bacterium]|nr:hypothetical protein [Verrucomicrobiales bacterium]HRI13370.1 hypothetical protein [Verrucomicrobiota bacterium]